MKLNILILLIGMSIAFSSKSQTTIEVYGNIVQDTIWSADTVKIIDDIYIDEGKTLRIMPGTFVEAQGFYHIQSSGNIIAIGTPNDSIFFSVADTTNFWADTTSNAGGWDGIHLENGTSSSSRFEYCNMAYGKQYYSYPNFPDSMGGALLRVKNYGSLHLINSRFHDNMLCHDYGVSTNFGGVLFAQHADTIDVSGCEFVKNRSFEWAAAISISTYCKNSVIHNNTFYNNVTFYYYEGPGWIVTGGGAAAIHCSDDNNYSPIIYGNKCYNNRGGGIIYSSNLESLIFNNLVFNNGSNYYNDGQGISDGHNLGHSRIFNNIVVNNSSRMGIYIFSKAFVYNNIVWGNKIDGEEIEDQIWIYDFPLVDPTLFNNCVEFGPGGIDSITDYPQFTNPTEDVGISEYASSADWSLLETSPCINTGTPDTTGLNLPEFDITGNPRVFGGRIDMGAYENQSVYVKINESPVYSKINVYPNPGNNEIYIDIPPEINGSWIDIVDGQGRILMHEQINISPAMLSPYKLKSGIYFYRIYNENGVIKSGKWVKNAG